jgi:hypothetical protein
MKTKIFIGSCVLFLLATLVNAQTSPPELISYQGIARDASGNPLVNKPIGIQLKIHQGAANGAVVFTETHSVTTNSLGLFSLQIGSADTSAFQSILWNNGPYFLEVLMDPNGGNAHTSIGTQQLLSVPYALYSKSSYSSAIAFVSYTTQNAPPISISSNTSATSTTLTLTQGSNTSSVQIDFPAPPPPSISITSASPSIVSVSPSSGNAFTISATPPSFTSSNGITNITGTYPDYTVTTTPSLSILGNSLSISGGNTVTLPTPTIIGDGIASITSGSVNSFTIDVPPTILSVSSSTTGFITITINQGNATSTTNFDILPAIQNNAWGVNGNTVTSSNYLGTNNSADLIFKTNNTERMRISPNGEVGINTNIPTAQLHIVTTFTDALQIDNGHIKATGSVVTTSTLINSCSSCSTFVPISSSSFTVTGNDVRGVLSLSAFTLIPSSNPIHENNFQINFTKHYTNPPHIVLTVGGDIPPSLSINAYVTEVSSGYFKMRIRTYMGGISGAVPISDLKIYYFVIE